MAVDDLDALLAPLPTEAAERIRARLERGARHEARLQFLQQVAVLLARTLDEDEILEEVARGLRRAVDCEGVVVARVDLDRALVEVVHHSIGDVVYPSRVSPLGSGPLGEAARTGEAVLVSPYDPATSPLAAADDVVDGTAAAGVVFAVPVMHGRRLLGVLAVHDPSPEGCDDEAREVVGLLARQAAGALSNARLFADSERERRQSEAMAEIARAVGESLKMGEVLRLILRHAAALLQAEGACVALRDGDYLHVVSAVGIAELLAGVHMPVSGSLTGQVVRSGAAVVTNDIASEPEVHRATLRLVPAEKSVIVPLMTARGILGVIAVYNRAADFTTDDARILQRLADQVAVAVVNARLYEEVRDATREWSTAFDSIGIGMCLVDDQGRITRSNARALQLTAEPLAGAGWSALLGRHFYDAMLGARPEADGDPLARAITDGIHARTVCEGVAGRWLDIMAVPHPNGGAVVTFDDVSTQRAAWDRHRSIVEASADALCTLDREGRVIFANPAARALFGRDDLTGAYWSDLLLHEMADEARQHVQLAATDAVQRHEYVVVRGDGERRVVVASLAPVREREHVALVVASMADVTNERRSREAVQHSEARYRQLFDQAGDAVLTLGLTGAVTSANRAAGEALDEPPEQLLGRPLHAFLAPGDVDRVTTFLRDVRHGEARGWECEVVRRNGTSRRLACTASPLREGRAIVGLLLVARDVTEARALSDAWQRSEARYAHLVEGAADAIFTVDEEGNFTSVNRAFEAATGHGRDAITGHHFTTLLDPRDRDSIWELFVGALHGQRAQREVRFLDASGRSRWGSLVASPITERGRVTGVVGVVRDVTAEKRLVEEVLRRERHATVGQLLGGVVHELSNPLAAVQAFSELLLDPTDAATTPVAADAPAGDAGHGDGERDAQREALATIRDEARRASRVLHNLLELTRERATRRATLRLTDVLSKALDIRRYALAVGGVHVVEEVAPELPETYGDAGRLQQAVLHLIIRAEHALRDWHGERRLALRLSRTASALVLVVEDSGPGIAAADLGRLFSPHLSTREGGDLAGLGLAVAEGIIREHGGRILVDSTPGHGATFVVELPIVEAPDAAVVAEALPATPGGGGALDVMVVDDEPAIRSALALMLGRLGHRIILAADGEEARAILERRSVDRIILDLRMPRLGGDALLAEIRDRYPALLPRVIRLTGDVEHAEWHETARAEQAPLLAKPFTLDDVRAAIARAGDG